MTGERKNGKGKNSGKLPGELAQVDLVMLEWFYKKISNKDLLKLFNISESTLLKIVKHYGFETDTQVRKERKSANMMGHTNQKKGSLSPLFVDRCGEKFRTKQGYEVEITKYTLTQECEYQFTHDRSFTLKSSYRTISKGNLSYPYHRTAYGVGYYGVGKHSYDKVEGTKKYLTWYGFIQRCYSPLVHARKPNYIGATVCEEWHNFQNFGDWYDENYKSEYMEYWELDKDILVKGNRIYSPQTCAFVPNELNLLLTKNKARRGNYPIGVFLSDGKFRAVTTINKVSTYFGSHNTPEEAFIAAKRGKEDYIKQKADEWKDLIDPRVYKSMYNYEVEITD